MDKLTPGQGKHGKKCVESYYSEKSVVQDSFSFTGVTHTKVQEIINNICADKATGLDGMPAKFLKDAVHQISVPLSHIINMFLASGIVPKELKLARVV